MGSRKVVVSEGHTTSAICFNSNTIRKRQRPWAKIKTSIAATALLTVLSSFHVNAESVLLSRSLQQEPMLGVDVFLEEAPPEEDVTPSPSLEVAPNPTLAPSNKPVTQQPSPEVVPDPTLAPSIKPVAEKPVTQQPSPSPFPEAVPEPTLAPSITPVTEKPVTPAPAPHPRNESEITYLKQAFPLYYDLGLTIEDVLDLREVLRALNGVLEEYIHDGLNQTLGTDQVVFTEVSLSSSLSRRLQMLRRLDRNINVAVEGAVQYDIDSTVPVKDVSASVERQMETLMETQNVNLAVQTAGVNGIVAVTDVTKTTEDGEEIGDSSENGSEPNGSEESESDGLTRPSTLSIVFGFILTAIAIMGLLVYAWIFYRKRQKRLKKRAQRMESIHYRMPIAPDASLEKPEPIIPVMQPTITTPSKEDSSDDESSYKGIESVAESEKTPVDPFARELQMAASLDEMAWEDYQRKKQAMGSNSSAILSPNRLFAAARSDEADDISGTRWAKSFPYGDEPARAEDPEEWNTSEATNISDWEPYHKAEEKKDEFGVASASREIPGLMTVESIERTLSQYGRNADDPPEQVVQEQDEEEGSPSDIVMEVARLARFVHKYEKRKERRQKWEQDRSERSRSFDTSSEKNKSFDSADPAGLRGSYLQRTTQQQQHPEPAGIRGSMIQRQEQVNDVASTAPTRPERTNDADPFATPKLEMNPIRPMVFNSFTPARMMDEERPNNASSIQNMRNVAGSARQIDSAGMITSFSADFMDDDPTFDDISDGDTFSDDSNRDEGSLRSHQRLGITPFSVQQPAERSFEEVLSSPMMQKLARGEALRAAEKAREDFSLPTDEQVTDRQRTQSDGDFYRQRNALSHLRNNTAIIDGSKSDVNVNWDEDPQSQNRNPLGPRNPQNTIPMASPNKFQKPTESNVPRIPPGQTPPAKKNEELKTPESRINPNSTFSRLRNLFEEKKQNAIFPPDQHWQYGVTGSGKKK